MRAFNLKKMNKVSRSKQPSFYDYSSAQDVQAFFAGGLKFSSGGLFLFKKGKIGNFFLNLLDRGNYLHFLGR